MRKLLCLLLCLGLLGYATLGVLVFCPHPATFVDAAGPVRLVAAGPDGELLASTNLTDPTIAVWDVSTGRLRARLPGHVGGTWRIAFSPDGSLLASGGDADGTVILWDVATGTKQAALAGGGGRVWSLAFSPDSRLVAAGVEDQPVFLWDVATGQVRHRLPVEAAAVAFSPDGSKLATRNHREVKLWATSTGTATGGTLERPHCLVPTLAFSPDGRLLAASGWDCEVVLYDVEALDASAPNPIYSVVRQDGNRFDEASCDSIAFSPGGKTVIGVTDEAVFAWNPQTGKLRRGYGLQGRPLSLTMDSVSNWLDLAAGPAAESYDAAAYTAAGRPFVVGSGGSTVRLWRGGGAWNGWGLLAIGLFALLAWHACKLPWRDGPTPPGRRSRVVRPLPRQDVLRVAFRFAVVPALLLMALLLVLGMIRA